jgi:predicted dinucleotide-binding enzyme
MSTASETSKTEEIIMLTTSRSIGIVGAGPVALSLAEVLRRAGYATVVSSRTEHQTRDGETAVVSFTAAAEMDIVFFAVRHDASRGLAERLRPLLRGKLVVDVDNAWLPGHYERAGLSSDLTEGQWMANLLPDSRVVRAFSHIDWNLFDRGLARPAYWGAGYAADDPESDAEIREILEKVGFVPVSAGSLAESAGVDVDGVLWSRLLPAAQTEAALRAR